VADDGGTRALAGLVTRWLVAVLAGSGVRLPGEEARLREVVHGAVAGVVGPALAHGHGKLVRDLRTCFAAPPGRELPAGAGAEDLRKAIAARVEGVVRAEPFYASYYRDEQLTRMLHDALVRALREFLANGPEVDAAQAARLNALGVDVDGAGPAVRNEVGGAVGGNLVQVGVLHGDVRIGEADEGAGAPVFVRVEVRASCHLFPEGSPHSFTAGGSGSVDVLVEARGARAVTLRSLRPVVLSRRPSQPTSLVVSTVGIMTPRRFEVDLDAETPRLVPAGSAGRSRLGRLLRRSGGAGFPYVVSPLDPEMFTITPRTVGHQVEWRLELDWTYRGRDGTTPIDDGGEPFRVMG